MSKLYRSLLWSGLVAAGVAACGDDVTVNQPTPTVHSVSVGPTGTIGVGQTVQMIASVNADVGIATTVLWTINAPASVATISGTGLLTAVGPGLVVVQACSTVNTSVCNNATITISSSAPTVTGITVTPGAQGYVLGQTPVTYTASVQGANNPPQTVAWSTASGLSTVVSVGAATGIVTIVAPGTEVVKACSTVSGFTNVCGSSSVTVVAQQPTQISLQGIEQGGIAVVLSNVSGQVEVILNVDPGAGSISKVQVLIGGAVAAEQTFTGPSAPAVAGNGSGANAVQVVSLSLNTAQVRKLTNNLFVPAFFNGPNIFSAKLFVTGSATAIPSSNVIPVVLKNQDALLKAPAFVLAPASTTPSFTNSVPSSGTIWYKGNVTFTGGNYVSFFPVTPASGTVSSTSCGTSGNALSSGTPQTGLTFSGTWSCGGIEGSVNLGSTFTITAGTAPAADVVDIAAVGFSQTGTAYTVAGESRYNLLTGGSAPTGTAVFIDNKAPVITPNEIGFRAGCFLLTPTFPVPGCWINGSYSLTGDFPAADGGSGLASVNTFSYVPGPPPLSCTSSSLTPANAAEDPSPTKYNACAVAVDNLGNTSTAFGLNAFGVDKTNPTITYVGTYASDSTVVDVIPVATIDYSVNDNNSGLENDALTLILTRLIADAAPTCPSGSIAATLAAAPAGVARSMVTPIPSPDDACGDQGYYTWTATVRDRAGNSATPAAPNNPVVFALDRTAPQIQAVAPQPLYGANQPANFLVFATDSTDLAGVRIEVRYQATCSGAGCTSPVNLGYNITSGFGTVWDAVLTTITTPPTGFPAVIPGTQVFGSFVIDTTVTLGGPDSVLTQADITAFDFFPNTSAVSNLLIPAVYKNNAQFPLAGSANPWATTGIQTGLPGTGFSGAGACTYTYDTPSNGPTIPTRVLVANQVAVGPPLVLDILSEITTTGTGLNVGDNPLLISDNGTFRRYRYLISGTTCALLGTPRLIAVKGTGAGLSAYLVP